MRKLLILLVLGAGLWSGYWVAGSMAIRQAAQDWFATQSARGGMVADHSALAVRGFPNRFDLTVEDLRLSDGSGFGWAAPFAQVFAMTWKPWHIIAALPPEQVVALPDQSLTITSDRLMGSLRARPAADLPLAETRLAGTAVAITSDLGWTTGFRQATLSLRAMPDLGPTTYALGLDLDDLTPDPGFLAAVRAVSIPDLPPSDLPDRLGRATGVVLLTLSTPLDRHIGTARPFLTGLEIANLRASWGALALSASGSVQADAKGYAAGTITVEITNWDRLPALMIAAGLIAPDLGPILTNVLKAAASQSPDASVLSIPLVLSGGLARLGPFPLGPAPLMVPPSG